LTLNGFEARAIITNNHQLSKYVSFFKPVFHFKLDLPFSAKIASALSFVAG
jgi:hypothetical protein